MLHTISEAAERLGIAPSTLRYYDKEGLLPFVERTKGGIRMFSDSDLEWLSVIGCLKKTGMPLKDIRAFVLMALEGDGTVGERLALIEKQRESVERQIAELREVLRILDFKRWYYQTAKSSGSTDIPRNMPDEELPEEFREVRRRLREGRTTHHSNSNDARSETNEISSRPSE